MRQSGHLLTLKYKDTGARYQADLQESEQVMDKAKARFDATAEELERILVAKEGENFRDAGMRTQNAANAAAGTGGAPAAGKKSGIGKGAAAMKKGLFKGKNPAQMAKHEEDVRARMASASEAFRKAVLESQAKRQEYFNFQLPKIVRVSVDYYQRGTFFANVQLLKDCADELDMGTQYHLTRYAYMYESTVVGEGTTLAPLNAEDGECCCCRVC